MNQTNTIFAKSILLTIGVVAVCFVAAAGIRQIDVLFDLPAYRSYASRAFGAALLLGGAVLRFWAAATFYRNGLAVLELKAQQRFIVRGPYRFTRNPLYIGITSIFLGLVIILGSVTGIVAAVLLFIGWHAWLLRFEERDLEKKFGSDYKRYMVSTPRWL